MKKYFIVIVGLLLPISLTKAANAAEKFSAAADIVAVTVNGKAFKVHEQNHVLHWNSAPSGRPERIVELKNLMITGTLPAGATLKVIEVATAEKEALVSFFKDRSCTQPDILTGLTIKAGEQVYYIKVQAPDGGSYQVYTLSIMGLDSQNHGLYYKYGEPDFVADGYHTWIWAVQNAKPGQRIAVTKIEQYLYKTGEYQHKPFIEDKQDLVIRSLSGRFEDLILYGHGFHKGTYRGGLPHDELFVVSGANTKNIVIYGVTVRESTANGFKLNGYGEENITFDHCRMMDINERAFKGSGPQVDGKYTRSKNISILNCWFENTQVPVESDHMAEYDGDYIGGIDVMNISGLTISGNTFKNITGKNRGARPPIFIWGQDGCSDVLIENNRIIHCDQGIAFGNYSGNPAGNSIGGFYINRAIIRNNFVYITDRRLDILEINRTNDVKIYNNTLWRANKAGRGIRDSHSPTIPSHNISIINNIVCGSIRELPQGDNSDIRHNLFAFDDPSGVVPREGNISFNVPETFFVNAAMGDFRLKESSVQAFRKGIPLVEVETDFFGTPRGKTPDLGAHQYTTENMRTPNSYKDQTFSELYDKPLADVLKEMQEKYQIKLYYSEREVSNKLVTYAIWKMHYFDVEATLTAVLYPLDFRFKKEGEKTYRITPFIHWIKPEAEGAAHLKALLDLYPTLPLWEARKEAVRKHILQQAGLTPMPQKTPLNPKSINKRSYDGYTVENVSLEVLPGVYLCGNLYKPAKKGKYPAMSCPHGHFDSPNVNESGRFRAEVQYRCAMLARMGVIAFCYDMFAWNESALQVPKEEHYTGLSMTMTIWNGIRVIDYLSSLSDVDSTRIGVTGASGGGTQSFYTAAFDPRIALSAPAVIAACHTYGACPCEIGFPIHFLENTLATNNVEIPALFAPKPQLIISVGKDMTLNTPKVEFPYLQAVYSLYGKKENVENAHFADEEHDYGPSKRFALYPFVAKHFNLDIKKIQDKDGRFDESRVTIEPAGNMFAFGPEQKLPANAVMGAAAVKKALQRMQQ